MNTERNKELVNSFVESMEKSIRFYAKDRLSEPEIKYLAEFEILFQYRRKMKYKSKYLAYDGKDVRARAKALADTLDKLCNKAGVKKFNSHNIRKSFASALSRCPDIDIATISEYMGHAQVSTTLNTYIIPANETIDNKIKQMSGYV